MKGPIADDWGWCITCHSKGYLLWVACGSVTISDFQGNYDSESPPDGKDVFWYVYPVVEVPFFYLKSWLKKLVGKLDINRPLLKLKGELRQLLEEEPRINLCDKT